MPFLMAARKELQQARQEETSHDTRHYQKHGTFWTVYSTETSTVTEGYDNISWCTAVLILDQVQSIQNKRSTVMSDGNSHFQQEMKNEPRQHLLLEKVSNFVLVG